MGDDDIIERANNGTRVWLDKAEEYVDAGKPADAKKMVTNAQKELRALKAEVVAEEREVRASFSEARLKASQSGQTLGLFVGSKARGAMARGRAAQKRSIAQQQQDVMEYYRKTKAALDDGVMQLDRVKLDIDLGKFSAAETTDGAASAAPAASLQAPPPAPAGWVADPTGRHELRYWSGTEWTEHVHTKGVQGVDPLT